MARTLATPTPQPYRRFEPRHAVVPPQTFGSAPAFGQFRQVTEPATTPAVTRPPIATTAPPTTRPGPTPFEVATAPDGPTVRPPAPPRITPTTANIRPSDINGSHVRPEGDGFYHISPIEREGAEVGPRPKDPATAPAKTPPPVYAGRQYADQSVIDPNNDLRSRQFLPGQWDQGLTNQSLAEIARAVLSGKMDIAPTDVSGARDLYGRALGEVEGARIDDDYGSIAAGTYENSPEATRSRALTMQALEGLNAAPDRNALASRAFQLLRDETQPQYEQDLRQVGQKAAAFGRLGAGMTTNELTDVYTTRERDLDRAQERLSLGASEQQMADMLARLQATGAIGGQFRNEDLADATMQRNLRDEARGERGFEVDLDQIRAALALQRGESIAGLGDRDLNVSQVVRGDAESDRDYGLLYDTNAANLALGRANAYGATDDRLFNQDVSRRNEMRDERGYQAERSDAANAIAMALAKFDWDQWYGEQTLRGAYGT